jgi:PAS domain S-box-containing protein
VVTGLCGALAEIVVLLPFASASSSSFRGVPGALGALVAVLTAVLAGPLVGSLVALGGSIFFVLFVADLSGGSWVAIVVWVLAAAAAGVAIRQLARAEREEAAHGRLNELLDGVDALVWEADADGRVQLLTGPVEKLLGVQREELLASPELARELVHPADRGEYDSSREAARGTGAAEVEYRARRGDGREVWLAESIRSVGGRDGGRLLRGVTTDVSERRELEERLAQARKLEAVGQLAGGIAHDFNNVLASIVGFASLLRRRGPDPETDALLEEIAAAGERGALLTNRLLSFTRQRVLKPRPIDVSAVVAGLEAMLRRLTAGRAELELELAGDLCPVLADPSQLEQVVMNLVVNARDALPDGGPIRVRTACGDGEVVLSVSDHGVGMDAATRARAFEPFFTTKPDGEGTGLGLATVHEITEQLGGSIEVTSRPGEGTTIAVRLPETQPAARGAATEQAGPAARPARRPLTVLLAEDEEMLRRLVSGMLEAEGHRVICAGDGEQALRLAAAHSDTIDLLLTDSLMPRLRGDELAGRLRATHPRLKVILMSGYAAKQTVDGRNGGDISEFLEKPFTADQLLDTIDRAFDAVEA